MGRALLGGSGTENAELLARVHREGSTNRICYTEKLLHRKGFTHRSFYTEKSLYRVVLTQRSLHTHRGVYTEKLRKSLCTQRL